MDRLNEKGLLSADEMAFRTAVIRKINQIVNAIDAGVVWENKAAADRAVDGVYEALPLDVTAAMVQEEYDSAMAELGLKETEVTK